MKVLEEKLIDAYEDGVTIAMLSERTGETKETVKKCLMSHGIFEHKDGFLITINFGE